MWATIENSSGTLQGGGPIVNFLTFSLTKRLDKAGSFNFSIPLSDPLADDLTHKYIVRFYDIVNDATVEIGAGIIESVRTRVTSDGVPAVFVSGDGMLAQLANLPIGNLNVFDTATRSADTVKFKEGGGGFTDWDNAEAAAGEYTLTSGTWGNDDKVYVGDDAVFNRIVFTFGGDKNDDDVTLTAEYWNGSEWTDTTITTDGTDDGAPFAQDGSIYFERMSDWATTAVDGETRYYIRLDIDETMDSEVDFAHIQVLEESATSSALSTIMGVTPVTAANWDVDASYHAEAENDWYGVFRDETSVLAALKRLANQTGEHFRYEGVDTGGDGDDEIAWLQDDETNTSYRAVRAPLTTPSDVDDNLCYILSLTETEDSYDLVTRVHPYGAGTGNLRLDMSETSYGAGDMPANYTLDTTNNLIESDTPDASYGRHDRTVVFPDIGASSSNVAQDTVAADALVDAALAWLQKRDAIITSYDMGIVGFPSLPKPGQLIPTVYQRWVEGTKVLDVDADLWILGVQFQLHSTGALIARLQVADSDTYPSSDADTLADNISAVNSLSAHSPGGTSGGTSGGVVYSGIEFVPLGYDDWLTSTDFDGDAYSTGGKAEIDMSTKFSLPSAAKAVYLSVALKDSGSASNNCWVILGDTNGNWEGQVATPRDEPNDTEVHDHLIVPLNTDGNMYWQRQASGVDTLDVTINIVGYWE